MFWILVVVKFDKKMCLVSIAYAFQKLKVLYQLADLIIKYLVSSASSDANLYGVFFGSISVSTNLVLSVWKVWKKLSTKPIAMWSSTGAREKIDIINFETQNESFVSKNLRLLTSNDPGDPNIHDVPLHKFDGRVCCSILVSVSGVLGPFGHYCFGISIRLRKVVISVFSFLKVCCLLRGQRNFSCTFFCWGFVFSPVFEVLVLLLVLFSQSFFR